MQDKHRAERPKTWRTVEEELRVADTVRALPKDIRVVILDCVTLWMTNMMLAGWSDARIEKAVEEVASVLAERPGAAIIVSNEVGAGNRGENGEFHSFVFKGPVFRRKIHYNTGGVIVRDGRFCFCDILPAHPKNGRRATRRRGGASDEIRNRNRSGENQEHSARG